MLVSGSACPSVWQLAYHHTEHTAEAVCGSVSLWMAWGVRGREGSGRPRATGLSGRRVRSLLTKMEKEHVGAWQAKSRCSGRLFCPVYMGRN